MLRKRGRHFPFPSSHSQAQSQFCTLCRNTAEKKLWVCFVSFGCCLVFNPVKGPHVRGLSLRTQSGVYLPHLPLTASEQKWAHYTSRQNTDLYPLHTFLLGGGGGERSHIRTDLPTVAVKLLSCSVFRRSPVWTSPRCRPYSRFHVDSSRFYRQMPGYYIETGYDFFFSIILGTHLSTSDSIFCWNSAAK